ncbi:MAG TPA: hypothetical protein VGM37_03330 [Armatimonadota bacterium]
MRDPFARVEALEGYSRLCDLGLSKQQIARLRHLRGKRGWMPLTEYNEMRRMQGLPESVARQQPDGSVIVEEMPTADGSG